MNSRPHLTIVPHGSTHVGLHGWEQFAAWAKRNDPRFKGTTEFTARAGVSELDGLKCLVASYAHALDEAHQRALAAGRARPLVFEVAAFDAAGLGKFINHRLGVPWPQDHHP